MFFRPGRATRARSVDLQSLRCAPVHTSMRYQLPPPRREVVPGPAVVSAEYMRCPMLHRRLLTTLLCLSLVPSVPLLAADTPAAQAQQTLDKALNYLKSQQKPDGSWTSNPREPIAISALVLRCFPENPRPEDAEMIKKGFDHLLKHQKPDGSIHTGMLANYNTAVIVSALARSKDPAHKAAMDKAVAYLKSVQWSDTITGPDGKPVTVGHPWHRGWGYAATGNQARPDLSNTAMVLEALRDAGVPKDDP